MSSTRLPPPPGLPVLIVVCFFLSGAAGLIYEVVWTRLLVLVFGSTTQAVSTVLAAFMGGLALGSFAAGRAAHRLTRLLRAYAALEIIIGLYALAVPFLFKALTPLYELAWRHYHLATYTLSLVQFVLLLAVLFFPTTAMGATLPFLSQACTRDLRMVGKTVGTLYGINTLGAVAGCASAGLVLVPYLGAHKTIWVASFINLALGVVVFAWSARARQEKDDRSQIGERLARLASSVTPHAADVPAPKPPDVASTSKEIGSLRLLLFVFAASGFLAMVYEVAWTRGLSLVLGSSVYAFTIMLTTFLLGLAVGGLAFAGSVDASEVRPSLLLGILLAGVGLAAYGTAYCFHRLPYVFTYVWNEWHPGFGSLLIVQLVLAAATMLLPTLLLGGVFPVVLKLVSRTLDRLGRSVGDAYAANTVGAILGSIAAGFVLIPFVGIRNTLTLCTIVNLLLAAVVLVNLPGIGFRRQLTTVAVCAVLMVAIVPFRPPWDPLLMSSGMYQYAENLRERAQSDRKPWRDLFWTFTKADYELLYYHEGVTTTVTVGKDRQGGNIWIATNGKIDASSQSDMPTQVLSAHLPLLLTPSADEVLVIGFASGVTVGSALLHPRSRVTAVEIEPSVIEASACFNGVNNQPLKEKGRRLQVVINDARNYLTVTDRRYDIIISEPSNPWMSGPSHLFTREFFDLARRRLRPGGVFCQWVQLYGMRPEDVRCLVATVERVFRNVFVLSTIRGADILLLASPQPLALDVRQVASRMGEPAVKRDLARERVNVKSVAALLAHFRLGPLEVRRFASGAKLNTDDNARIEFSAPRSLYSETGESNEKALEAAGNGLARYLTAYGATRKERAVFLARVALACEQQQSRTVGDRIARESIAEDLPTAREYLLFRRNQ